MVLGHQDKKDKKILKQDQPKVTKMVRRSKYMLFKKQLKVFGLFSMEKGRSREDLNADLYSLMRDYSDDITRLLSEVYSKWTSQQSQVVMRQILTGYKEKQNPQTKQTAKPNKVVKYWNRLPR